MINSKDNKFTPLLREDNFDERPHPSESSQQHQDLVNGKRKFDIPEDNAHLDIYDKPETKQFSEGYFARTKIFLSKNYLIYTGLLLSLLIVIIIVGVFLSYKSTKPTKKPIDITSHTFKEMDGSEMLKPLYDKNFYRQIELPNGLKAILVSSPHSSSSAAALSVAVGSSHEPRELPGLAHFLEHMLFLGSEKYPEETAYKDWLGKSQGKANAFTSDEATTYYFEVESSALEKTLDIFSRFFIDPLLKNEMINREVNAVNSEYENDLQSDIWRFLELLRRLSSPSHPFHYFHIGNKNTLKDFPENNINLREQLVKFYNEYYSSHLMTLALVGPESLDELENMAVEKFSIVPRRKASLPSHLQDVGVAFPASNLGKFVWYRPVAKEKLLHIVFPISGYIPNSNQVRPIDFIEYFLDNSGPGSFKELAREKGWINGLKTMISSKYSDFTLLRIHFKLTDKGLDSIHEILESFFAYLRKIKDDAINQENYNQLSLISYLNFIYQGKPPLSDEVVSLVSAVGKTQLSSLLSKGKIFLRFKKSEIINIIDELLPSKSLILIGSDKLEISPILEKVSFRALQDHHKFKQINKIELNIFKDLGEEMASKFNKDGVSTSFSRKISVRARKNKQNLRFKENILEAPKATSLEIASKNSSALQILDKQNNTSNQTITADNDVKNLFNTNVSNSTTIPNETKVVKPESLNKHDDIMKIHFAIADVSSEYLFQLSQQKSENNSTFNVTVNNQYLPLHVEMYSKCYSKNGSNSSSYNKGGSPKLPITHSDLLNHVIESRYNSVKTKLNLNNSCFEKELRNDRRSFRPRRVFNDSNQFWFKTDRIFMKPKTVAVLQIDYSNRDKENIEEYLVPTLIINYIHDILKRDFYDAILLGYRVEVHKSASGLEYIVSGFSNKVPMILERLIDLHLNLTIQENDFENQKQYLQLHLKNHDKEPAYKQLVRDLDVFLGITKYQPKELLKKLEDLSYAQFLDYFNSNYKQIEKYHGIFVGNLGKSQARNISKRIKSKFSSISIDESKFKVDLNNDLYEKLYGEKISNKSKEALKLDSFLQIKSINKNLSLNSSVRDLPESTHLSPRINQEPPSSPPPTSALKSKKIQTNINSTVTKNRFLESGRKEAKQDVKIIKKDVSLLYRSYNENPDDLNHGLLNYYQYGIRNLSDFAALGILTSILKMRAFLFLRTKHQLGYIVYTFISSEEHEDTFVDGLIIEVQGSKKSPLIMDRLVEQFLGNFSEILNQTTDAEINALRDNFVENLKVRDSSLVDMAKRLWRETENGKYDYLKNRHIVKEAKNLTKKDIVDFYDRFFRVDSRKLSLQKYRQTNLTDEEQREIKENLTLDGEESFAKKKVEVLKDILN